MARQTGGGWSVAALVVGAITAITGAWLVAAYVLEAVIARAGEPDQSLLFWYLPLLLMGVIFLLVGLGVAAWGVSRRKRLARERRTAETLD